MVENNFTFFDILNFTDAFRLYVVFRNLIFSENLKGGVFNEEN